MHVLALVLVGGFSFPQEPARCLEVSSPADLASTPGGKKTKRVEAGTAVRPVDMRKSWMKVEVSTGLDACDRGEPGNDTGWIHIRNLTRPRMVAAGVATLGGRPLVDTVDQKSSTTRVYVNDKEIPFMNTSFVDRKKRVLLTTSLTFHKGPEPRVWTVWTGDKEAPWLIAYSGWFNDGSGGPGELVWFGARGVVARWRPESGTKTPSELLAVLPDGSLVVKEVFVCNATMRTTVRRDKKTARRIEAALEGYQGLLAQDSRINRKPGWGPTFGLPQYTPFDLVSVKFDGEETWVELVAGEKRGWVPKDRVVNLFSIIQVGTLTRDFQVGGTIFVAGTRVWIEFTPEAETGIMIRDPASGREEPLEYDGFPSGWKDVEDEEARRANGLRDACCGCS